MSSPEIALQKALLACLWNDVEVLSLVPRQNIIDRNARPIIDPSIIIGEDQGVDEGFIKRNVTRVYHTIHVWKKEESLAGVKRINASIKKAIRKARFQPVEGFHFADLYVSGDRTLRDPDGLTSHGVVTVEALIQEVA